VRGWEGGSPVKHYVLRGPQQRHVPVADYVGNLYVQIVRAAPVAEEPEPDDQQRADFIDEVVARIKARKNDT
jgi:hypothetical protein